MSSAMGPTPPPSSIGEVGGTAPARQMRLKIAYSFDDNDKSNCLARWPNVVNTPVVQVDDMLVGAVELKICILTIISSSPELVATLGKDYSVYAHDYSEPGIPLVGCGLLSWAILNAQNSSTRIMVTGRVNRNTFGFFSNDGVKETLEVKLRLQKIDTFTQEQFVQSVRTYTAISKTLPGDFDASTWSRFLESNPQILGSRPADMTELPPSEPLGTPVPSCPPEPEPEAQPAWASNEERKEDAPPPKKKARTAASRRNNGAANLRKKAAPKPNTKASSRTQKSNEPTPTPTPPPTWTAPPPLLPRETSTALPELPRESSSLLPLLPTGAEISPSPQNTAVLASSPPIQQEDTVGLVQEEPSPAPTSPVLPSLPAPPRPQSVQHMSMEGVSVKVEAPSDVIPSESAQLAGLVLPQTATPINNLAVTLLDDTNTSTALSPESTQCLPKPKNAKRNIRRSQSTQLPLDVIASSEIGDGQPVKKPAAKKRTAAQAKQRIEKQLLDALKKGEMPNYCRNCGAIETAVWRKVKVDCATESSTENDQQDNNDPNKSADKDGQVLLCNPCGLWFNTHKAMRPQELWDSKKEKEDPGSRKRKKSTVTPAPQDSQPSEPCTEPIVVPDEDEVPLANRASFEIQKRATMTPKGNRALKDINPEWNAAIVAAQRYAQSSPVQGSAMSPIEIDGIAEGRPSPRRLLFTPRGGNLRKASGGPVPVPKVLDSVKDTAELSDKENLSPDEPVDGSEIVRPTTPVKNLSIPLEPRTPLRSVSKTIGLTTPSPWKSSVFGSGKLTNDGSPATPERRLAKSQQQRNSLSPTADLLERLLAESNPDDILSFDMDDDFWNTGIPTDPAMPSSPPRQFDLLKDHNAILGFDGGDWSEIVASSSPGGLNFDVEGAESIGKEGAVGPVVDLSAFIGEALTHVTSSSPSDGNTSS